jgi:hypothetical protein
MERRSTPFFSAMPRFQGTHCANVCDGTKLRKARGFLRKDNSQPMSLGLNHSTLHTKKNRTGFIVAHNTRTASDG